MIENIHSVCINTAYVCAAGVGAVAVTNHHGITVGPQTEPATEFSIDCQKVFFLNDADFLAPGECPTNRPERIRPVTLRLVGARGTGGYVSIANEGAARAVLFLVEDGVTNRIDASTRIRLDVADDSFVRECVKTVYMSCPVLGRGTFRATWTPNEGSDLSDEASYQVIEPIRKLVNTERFNGTGPIMNPSRLVYGTNAILKVSVKLAAGDTFALTNEVFRRVSGPGRIVSQWRMGNDWYARVAATAVNGEFEVEARFSDEESQPRFWLPVVQERVLHVRAFVVENGGESSLFNWEEDLIRDQFDEVNDIYSQVGVRFSLDEVRTSQVGTCDDWTIDALETYVDANGRISARYTEQIHRLLRVHESNDCIRVFFTGKIMVFGTQYGAFTMKQTEPHQAIFMSTATNVRSLAHELGHALGLAGCLPIPRERSPDHPDGGGSSLVLRDLFPDGRDDWGTESGRGYYETSESVEDLIERLLMFERTSLTKSDLPDRRILSGLPRITNGQRKGPVNAGAFYIIPNDERIYKHEN